MRQCQQAATSCEAWLEFRIKNQLSAFDSKHLLGKIKRCVTMGLKNPKWMQAFIAWRFVFLLCLHKLILSVSGNFRYHEIIQPLRHLAVSSDIMWQISNSVLDQGGATYSRSVVYFLVLTFWIICGIIIMVGVFTTYSIEPKTLVGWVSVLLAG